MIKLTDIKEQAYREIYIGDEESAIQSINALQRTTKWEGGFQFDLLISFWLGIHKGRIKVLNHLITYDLYLRQLVTLALQDKPEKPRGYKPSKRLLNECAFNKLAYITAESEHLAGFKNDKEETTHK